MEFYAAERKKGLKLQWGTMMGEIGMRTLLVGMRTGAATMENSMEFPQKTKDGTAFPSSDPTAGIMP